MSRHSLPYHPEHVNYYLHASSVMNSNGVVPIKMTVAGIEPTQGAAPRPAKQSPEMLIPTFL